MVIAVKALDSLGERFFAEQSTVGDIDNRERLSLSAYLMGKDHLFGVGLGNFHFWSMNRYAQQAGAEAITMAHNIWYLTFAEIGLPGLMAFALLWLRYYQVLLSSMIKSWRMKDPLVFPLLLGALVASEIIQFQNLFHFSYRNTAVFLIIHIIMAVTVRMYLELKSANYFGSSAL
jgi:hypothetical protein